MKITLITEGTYPFHMGGVSVWCDQLLRDFGEHRFNVLALTATGDEPRTWELPTNVDSVVEVPLWGRQHGRAKRAKATEYLPVLERFFRSLETSNGFFRTLGMERSNAAFVASLKELADLARSGKLHAAMSSVQAVDLLLSMAPRCSDRASDADEGNVLSMADAVDVLTLLEHFLRPLAIAPPTGEICHSVANGLGALPALAAKWDNKTPFLLTEHGLYLRERYLSYKPGTLNQPARAIILRFFRLLVETAYEAADIVAPGSGYNRTWEMAQATPSERIFPLRNGIDPAEFPVATTEPEVPTLSWIGRVDPLKDVETLLRAFAEVRVAIPECRLRMFGPTPDGGGEYARRCLDLLSELGLDGAATFEGRVGSVVDAYHAGHVVMLTSISEGLPYTVLEAMACGRPVIATDVGGVGEAVGETGILVPPRQPSEIAAACVRLLSDADLRHSLGAAARERVENLFTAKRSFQEYRRLYRNLGTNRSSKAGQPGPRGGTRPPKVRAGSGSSRGKQKPGVLVR